MGVKRKKKKKWERATPSLSGDPQQALADVLHELQRDELKETLALVNVLPQFLASGHGGDIAITPAFIAFLRALGTPEDILLAKSVGRYFLASSALKLCEILQVYPRVSSLHVMENYCAKPDLGDDVGDYDDALDAAFAAEEAMDALFTCCLQSAESTIQLRLQKALDLPDTPPPRLASIVLSARNRLAPRAAIDASHYEASSVLPSFP